MPLRPLRAQEVVRKLERAGFRLVRQKGSHARYVDDKGQGVTVLIHSGDVPSRVIRYILKQANLTEEQWGEL